jgi:signal transduction histidine kinase
VERLRPQLASHPLLVEVERGLPAARIDPIHIEHVLTNLMENAARYSPEGAPVTVLAGTAASPSGVPEMHLAVSDQGIGIAPEEQEKIFDKFYRTAGSGRRSGGTGMGLAIVKGLVEANGGQVVVESEPGRGSTFTVVLPLGSEAAAEDGPDVSGSLPRELPAR